MTSSHGETTGGHLEQRLRDAFAGRFEIEREIVGGGMSRVFLAQESALGRPIVIKILPPDIAAEVNRDRFRREIQFAARLQHPHVVPLLSAGEEGGLLYYTMPFIDGESLKAKLTKGHKFGAPEVVDILLDVAGALAYAHREGVVHRDIKPANILLKERHAVVTDFGVAKAIGQAIDMPGGTSTATTTGVAIGTPAYMAPEQVAGDTSADHRVDIYALGLLAYELMTGHAPFRGSSPQAIMAAQLTQQPEPLTVARPDMPITLSALVMRCLEKEAQRRPPSAEAVLEVLRTIDAASGSHTHHMAQGKRRRSTAAFAGAVVLAAAAGTWWLTRAPAPPPVAPPPPPPVAPPVDSVAIARRADSMRRVTLRTDSLKTAAALSQLEQRLMTRLRDSITDAVRRTDSVNEATRRAEDARRGPPPGGGRNFAGTAPPPPPPATRAPLPRDFAARIANLGPARRVIVGLGSSLPRSPDVIVQATLLRDSLVQRLRQQGRFIIVPVDSVDRAMSLSRQYDSLSSWLRAEVFVMINGSPSRGADSLRWSLSLRDLSAYAQYQNRSVSTSRMAAIAEASGNDVTALFTLLMQQLNEMDRSPRRDSLIAR